MSYSSVFGGSPVAPSQPSFEALSMSANTALAWPLELTGGTPYVADLIYASATATGLQLMMPPGNTGSTGVACIISNVGSNTFTLTDRAGNVIVSIPATQAWMIALTDNTTANGTWTALQLASTTSSATSGSLAGPGIQALSTQLQTWWQTVSTSANTSIVSSYRSTLLIWTGSAAGTWTLDTVTNLTAGWFFAYSNEGTAAVTIGTTGGATINGAATLVVQPGDSGILVCAAGGFYTFGGINGVLSITQGGTGASNAATALTNFGGTEIGQSIFTAPSASAVVSLLGLQNFTFQELTVSTPQTLAAGSSSTMFVCTAALTITLPLSTTLSTQWVVGVYAQDGTVTVTPQASDAINGGTAGVSFTMAKGTSALFTTDANGNIWPFFVSTTPSGTWVTAGGTSDAITATYTPPNLALTDGLLLGFRAAAANLTSAPTFAPDGFTAATIVYDGGFPLLVGAIPGAGAECLVRYNVAEGVWELLNPATPLEKALVLDVAGSVNITLTSAQTSFPILDLYGAITGNITIFVPAAPGNWIVRNSTTGPYTLSIQPTGGELSQLVTQGYDRALWTDGTNMYSAIDDPANFAGIYETQTAFTTPGTSSFVVPANVYNVELEVEGGGGGGGASATCTSSQVSVAPGGNSGARAVGVVAVTPGQTITITVGAGGAGGVVAGANGQPGGTSSFGTAITAPGGHGATNAPAIAPPAVQSPPPTTNIGTGGTINEAESSGQSGMAGGLTNTIGGAGGGRGGGSASTGGAVGNPGASPGAGGGGANTQASGSGNAGGTGASGAVYVRYLAGT